MSRIYDDQKLQNLPLINKSWTTPWNVKLWTQKGCGALVEGSVQNKHRVCVTDSTGAKNRYILLLVKVSRAHRRQFDSKGQEIEPNFSQTTKVSTGFLNSSYKVEAKGQSDILSEAQLSSLISVPELTALTRDLTSGDLLLLWLPETSADSLEIELGTDFRFKTQGDSPFVCSMSRQEGQWSTTANYAGGEQVGASWTDKIMAVKASAADSSSATASTGVDVIADEEWDD